MADPPLERSSLAARPQPAGSLAASLAAELSREDLELLRLLARGLPLEAVARRLHTSERTVRRRIKGICERLGVSASIEAVVWAARRGLV
jgi:DNA-binding NarL/FixJ family response regulator